MLKYLSRMLFITLVFSLSVIAQNDRAGDEEKFYTLTDKTASTYAKQDFETAEALAKRLLVEAENWKENWNYGNSVHVGNLVIGLIALERDEVLKAKKHLIAAGTTPGSPQLDTFGPNMLLAEKLLEKGETGVVLDYFDLCAKFWKSESKGKLAVWIEDVKADRKPDFGANLRYQF